MFMPSSSWHYYLNMKKIGLIIIPIIAIFLETLPSGVVMVFASSPTQKVTETFSYFSLLPFGYANITPFITVLFSCAILLLAIISLKKTDFVKYVFSLSLIGIIFSIMPIMAGVDYLTYPGVGISLLLTIECVLARSYM